MKKLRNSHVKIIHSLADCGAASPSTLMLEMRRNGWFTGFFYGSMTTLVENGFVTEYLRYRGRTTYELTSKGFFAFLVGPSPRTTWIDRAWTRFMRWSESP